MEEITYSGIVLKQAEYGDAHRMLTILTKEAGIIKAVRYGIRGKKAANAAAFQTMCYARFKLQPGGGSIMTAKDAEVLDCFSPISEDIKKLALMVYLGDITYGILGSYNPDERIAALYLNTVYAAAYRNELPEKLKTVYEIKLMCAAGYMPQFNDCEVCGGKREFFNNDYGCFFCREHRKQYDKRISEEEISLMHHIAMLPDKKMLSFNIVNEKLYRSLGEITEYYVSAHAGRDFSSLKYYRSVEDF